MNHKITPGITGASRVNTEFVWTDETRVQEELRRLQDEIEALQVENARLRKQCAKRGKGRGDRV